MRDRFLVRASIDDVWEFLMDPRRVASCTTYVSNKAADVATYVAMERAAPQSSIQNSLALAISLGSYGDRRQGEYGFAAYEDCIGACQVGNLFLGGRQAFTPGYLAFSPKGRGPLSSEFFRHENQHHLQSLLVGPAYLPATILGSCLGWCHDSNPFERDAIRAEDPNEGLHFPFLP